MRPAEDIGITVANAVAAEREAIAKVLDGRADDAGFRRREENDRFRLVFWESAEAAFRDAAASVRRRGTTEEK